MSDRSETFAAILAEYAERSAALPADERSAFGRDFLDRLALLRGHHLQGHELWAFLDANCDASGVPGARRRDRPDSLPPALKRVWYPPTPDAEPAKDAI